MLLGKRREDFLIMERGQLLLMWSARKTVYAEEEATVAPEEEEG